MIQMCPISRLTEPVRQGIVKGRVFLSILVNEWYLMPECWLSLGLVKSILFLAFERFAIQLLSVNQVSHTMPLYTIVDLIPRRSRLFCTTKQALSQSGLSVDTIRFYEREGLIDLS
jgi:hypothetical protein